MNVWFACLGTRSKFELCQEEHFMPELLNYIDKVFWPHSPVKKSVKMWDMKVSCSGSLISSCLAAGESWCWLGSVRRKAPPAGRGGWSLSTWGFGSWNASDGPTRSRFVYALTHTHSSVHAAVIKRSWVCLTTVFFFFLRALAEVVLPFWGKEQIYLFAQSF